MGLMSVRPYIRPSVRPSTKSFSDSDEIWYVGRGRWMMHDGMPYDPIQGQGHETFKVRNASIFKIYLLRLANDHWFWNYGTISNFCMEKIFDICPSFCVTWLGTGWHWFSLQMFFQLHSLGGSGVRSWPSASVPYGANFFTFHSLININ